MHRADLHLAFAKHDSRLSRGRKLLVGEWTRWQQLHAGESQIAPGDTIRLPHACIQDCPELRLRKWRANVAALEYRRGKRRPDSNGILSSRGLAHQRRRGMLDARHTQRRAVAALRGRPTRVRVTEPDFVGIEPEQLGRRGVQALRQRHDPVHTVRCVGCQAVHGIQAVAIARLARDDEPHPFRIDRQGRFAGFGNILGGKHRVRCIGHHSHEIGVVTVGRLRVELQPQEAIALFGGGIVVSRHKLRQRDSRRNELRCLGGPGRDRHQQFG